ncbi:hypothetical protein DPMN_021702 [Dreissena polymorpha]|uniref:Uncharacterized protein n=1 Tax=Dreissena polymorpha TaxID=45954 RepID=A0A9D4NPE5_DREPO|nr:hypothetical protein DPMN_021702 [Dreissena polymorpha]
MSQLVRNSPQLDIRDKCLLSMSVLARHFLQLEMHDYAESGLLQHVDVRAGPTFDLTRNAEYQAGENVERPLTSKLDTRQLNIRDECRVSMSELARHSLLLDIRDFYSRNSGQVSYVDIFSSSIFGIVPIIAVKAGSTFARARYSGQVLNVKFRAGSTFAPALFSGLLPNFDVTAGLTFAQARYTGLLPNVDVRAGKTFVPSTFAQTQYSGVVPNVDVMAVLTLAPA